MEVSFRLTLDKNITRNEKEAGQVVLTFLLRGGSYYRGIFLGGHGRGSSTPFQPHLKEYQAKQHSIHEKKEILLMKHQADRQPLKMK